MFPTSFVQTSYSPYLPPYIFEINSFSSAFRSRYSKTSFFSAILIIYKYIFKIIYKNFQVFNLTVFIALLKISRLLASITERKQIFKYQTYSTDKYDRYRKPEGYFDIAGYFDIFQGQFDIRVISRLYVVCLHYLKQWFFVLGQ